MKIGDKVRVKTKNLKTHYIAGGYMESMLGCTCMIIELTKDGGKKWARVAEPNDLGFWWHEEDLEFIEEKVGK